MTQPPFENLVDRQGDLDKPYDKPLAFVVCTMRDGSVVREGPYSKWVAEMVVGSGMYMYSDVYSLVIQPVEDFDRYVGEG